VTQEPIIVFSNQGRLDLARCHVDHFKAGKGPKNVIRTERARSWHFDEDPPDLAVSVEVSNGGQGNDSNPVLRRAAVATIGFAADQGAVDICALVRFCLLEALDGSVTKANRKQRSFFQRPRGEASFRGRGSEFE